MNADQSSLDTALNADATVGLNLTMDLRMHMELTVALTALTMASTALLKVPQWAGECSSGVAAMDAVSAAICCCGMSRRS